MKVCELISLHQVSECEAQGNGGVETEDEGATMRPDSIDSRPDQVLSLCSLPSHGLSRRFFCWRTTSP
jgi:hypothetical protein